MEKIRAIIADDEPDAIEILSSLLTDSGKVEVIAEVINAKKIESIVNKYKPDVLFLDIEMPDISGLDLLENVREYNQDLPIILITAYNQYVADAIKLNVFSYMLKPVDRQELNSLIDKLNCLNRDNPVVGDNGKIKLPIQDGYVFMHPNDFLLLEANGNYTRIETVCGEVLLSSYNMGRLSQKLCQKQFLRINRSCILNSKYLYKVNKKKLLCTVKIEDREIDFNISQAFVKQFNKIMA